MNATIGALLARQVRLRPDSLFAIFPDCTLTLGELDIAARKMAKGLIAFGIEPGDHVATLMPNVRDWLITYFGTLYAGARLVALNARYKRHELAFTIKHSDSKMLLTTDAISAHVDFGALLRATLDGLAEQENPRSLGLKVAPMLRNIVMCGDTVPSGFLSMDALLSAGEDIPDSAVERTLATASIDDTVAIMYTSGTTSLPKACELTHRGLQNSWHTFANVVNLAEGETVWMPMPFYHTGGIGPMTAILHRGAAFMTQAHYQPEGVIELIEQHRIEHLYPGFPQLSLNVIDHPSFTPERFGFVRSLLNVGPEAMQYHIQGRLPPGAVLLNLFGMTEGSGIVTFTPIDTPIELRALSSGIAPDHTEIRIVDPETGDPLEGSETGEIQFRGGGALKCYYKDPDATSATILPGGWVKTGDRGRIDAQGYLTYAGRLKDMIRVGGENVAAAEIEAFIQRLPGVKLVQVISVPDDRLGEVPYAFVERSSSGTELTAQDVIAFCRRDLARWKVPKGVQFLADWPMSATKIQKFKLRDLVETTSTEA